MIKAAVTGASGHIGNCLVSELIKKGLRVKALVHDFENDLGNMDVEIVRGNLLDIASLRKLCDNVDVVFHLAAQISLDNRHRNQVYAVNSDGTKNLIEASKAAAVKKLIHFSSIDAFEFMSSEMVFDEKFPLTESKKSVYAFSKAESERLVMQAVSEGLNAVVLCPTAVVGPFDYRGSFLGEALVKIYKNKIPMLIPGGYNWVDVRDVAEAAIRAAEVGRNGEKYILSGTFSDLKNLSQLIGKISGRKTPEYIVPLFLAELASPFYQLLYLLAGKKPLYTRQSLQLLKRAPKKISSEKAKNELGYSPRPLEQTLIDTFNWYNQNNYLN